MIASLRDSGSYHDTAPLYALAHVNAVKVSIVLHIRIRGPEERVVVEFGVRAIIVAEDSNGKHYKSVAPVVVVSGLDVATLGGIWLKTLESELFNSCGHKSRKMLGEKSRPRHVSGLRL